jgi:hypothetical protein
MNVYQVTVIYTHTDGRQVEAVAFAAAPNPSEAIQMAAEAVRELPHCESLIGGWCEDVTNEVVPPHAREDSIPQPASATRH